MNLTCEHVILQVHRLDGVVVAVYLNKLSYNILINLGFISPELSYYPYLMNSDAHSLGLINAPLYYLEVLKGNRLFSDDLKGETK